MRQRRTLLERWRGSGRRNRARAAQPESLMQRTRRLARKGLNLGCRRNAKKSLGEVTVTVVLERCGAGKGAPHISCPNCQEPKSLFSGELHGKTRTGRLAASSVRHGYREIVSPHGQHWRGGSCGPFSTAHVRDGALHAVRRGRWAPTLAFQRMVDVINRSVVVIGGVSPIIDDRRRRQADRQHAQCRGGLSQRWQCGYSAPQSRNRACVGMLDNAAGWPNAPMTAATMGTVARQPDGVFLSRATAAKQGPKKGDVFSIVATAIPRRWRPGMAVRGAGCAGGHALLDGAASASAAITITGYHDPLPIRARLAGSRRW